MVLGRQRSAPTQAGAQDGAGCRVREDGGRQPAREDDAPPSQASEVGALTDAIVVDAEGRWRHIRHLMPREDGGTSDTRCRPRSISWNQHPIA